MSAVQSIGEQISRRQLILLTVSAAAAAWTPARAASGNPRIGFLAAGSSEWGGSLFQSFETGLAALGWRQGANCSIDERWTEEQGERLPNLASDLIAGGVDILVTAGTAATAAAINGTTVIPIVMVGVGDPVAIGAADSLDHPGGNATGLTLSSRETVGLRLQLLRELIPDLKRLAVVIRHDPGLEQTVAEIRSSAAVLGMPVVAFEATSGRTIEYVFKYLRNERCDALYVASGPLGPAKRAQIISLAQDARLPTMFAYRGFALDGGLIAFATDDNELFRRAAAFVDKILRGTKPAEIRVEPPMKFELTVNLKAAKRLNLSVPQTILSRADEVIG